MKLSVVIVNRNGREFLGKCLRSVFDQTKAFEFEVILVDNGSSDDSVEMVQKEFPMVVAVENLQNIGFAAANNQGAKLAKGEFVLLLNPDTEIVGDAISETVSFMESNCNVGIVGCRLILPDGSTQSSVRSFPSLWNVFCESTFLVLAFPRSRLFGRYYMSYFDYERTAKVDWVSGAFFLVRKEQFCKLEGLDKQFFLFSEEMDFCLQANRAGYEVWYFAEAQVKHFWGGANAFNRPIIIWTNGSQLLYFQKNFNAFKAFLLTILKMWGLVNRTVLYFLMGILFLDGRNLQKSYFHAVALMSLILDGWKYRNGSTEPGSFWFKSLE